MKRGKRLGRGAVRLALLLLALLVTGFVVNLALMGYALVNLANTSELSPGNTPRVQSAAEALAKTEGDYELPAPQLDTLRHNGDWAMLIGMDGTVLWSADLPPEIPASYTINDVASMTRWYLKDYPVKVWTRDDGLFVLGSPKGSMWKYSVEMPVAQLTFMPYWAALALLCNFLVVLCVSAIMLNRWHKKRDDARTEWIAGVSHDIRTPLSVVLGYAEELVQDGALPEEEHRRAQAISAKSTEMRALIADLNLVNRLEYAMEPLQTERVSLPALLRETAAEFINADADEKYPVEVEISPKAAAASVKGDRALLKRMLRNLIGNSARHNPQGCEIKLTLDRRGWRNVICVSDTGVGFTDEQLRGLRERSEAPLSHGEHGLGLRLVRQICAAHGGSVRFLNSPEGGGRCEVRV